MENLRLSKQQCLAILVADGAMPYIREFAPKESHERPEVMSEDAMRKVAEYVFSYASTEIHKYENENGEIVISELAGVYGLWSEATDWLYFDSETRAVEFVSDNLGK